MPDYNTHNFNDDGVCEDCGFDGAEHHWLYFMTAKAELGEDEWQYRKNAGEFDIPSCTTRRA